MDTLFVAVGIVVLIVIALVIYVATSPKPNKDRTRERTNFYDNFELRAAQLIERQTHQVTEISEGKKGANIKIYDKSGTLVGVARCVWQQENTLTASGYIREVAAMRTKYNFKFAYLVTSGHLSEEGREIARRMGIRTIEGRDLKRSVESEKRAVQSSEKAVKTQPVDYSAYMPSINGMWDDD